MKISGSITGKVKKLELRLNNGILTKKVEIEEYALFGSIVILNTKLRLFDSEICVKSETVIEICFQSKIL